MNIFFRYIKNLACILSSGVFAIGFSSYNCNATIEDTSTFEDFTQFKYIGYENDIEHSSNQYEFSTVTDSNYPSYYDMRELGLVSSTNHQGSFGTCWAFATTESAVSGILSREPFADFSEWHLTYFTYTGDDSLEMYSKGSDNNAFKKGGNSSFSITTLSKWIGFADESIAPYNSSLTLDESLRFNSKYHLTDAYSFNSAFSSNTSSAYSQDDIKSMILNGNSVMLNMYYKNSSDYYNSSSNSYYCADSNHSVNHGVTIVGWDDDFNDFDGLINQPKSKGAWLVKNSWGYEFGDYGYFWVSYENVPVIDATAYIVSSNENYSSNQYLDDYGWTTSINSLNENRIPFSASRYYDFASNVFTSNEDTDVCAVSIYTTDYNTEYTISIYKNLTDDTNPTSGTLMSTILGTQEYMGYHTISLENPVSVSKDEKYSIVVKFKNPSYKNTIAIESSISFLNVVDNVVDVYTYNVSVENILKHTEVKQSFISNDGKTWTDTRGITGIMLNTDNDFTYGYTYDYDTSQLSDGNYAISTLGNVCIKAFTNPHDKVYFSQYGGNLYDGETIELSNHNDDYTIYYTLDGSTPTLDSSIYTEPIQFTGEDLTISARTLIDGHLGDTYTETFKQSKAVLSTLCAKQYNGKDYTYTDLKVSDGEQPNTTIYLDCSEDIQSIELFPISTGSITINGDTVTSGHEYGSINVYNGMIIPITVTQDGSLTTEYNLVIKQGDNKLLGDVNNDSSLSIADLLLMKKHTLNVIALSNEQIISGDCNNDSIINVLDILYLKNILLE